MANRVAQANDQDSYSPPENFLKDSRLTPPQDVLLLLCSAALASRDVVASFGNFEFA